MGLKTQGGRIRSSKNRKKKFIRAPVRTRTHGGSIHRYTNIYTVQEFERRAWANTEERRESVQSFLLRVSIPVGRANNVEETGGGPPIFEQPPSVGTKEIKDWKDEIS